MNEASAGAADDGGTRPGRPAGRKLAEWVTLSLSVALVVGVAAFLVYGALHEHPRFAPVQVRVLTGEAWESGGQFIVPVEVRNLGRRTLKEVKIQVAYASADGGKETRDVVIDFLGEGASHNVYLYLDRHPRQLAVEARPSDYQLD